MNKELLRKMLDEDYVMVQKHPDAELYIYNYTRKAQFEKVWNEITLLTRGLILDGEMNIVARAFKKFFTLEQHQPEDIPNLPFDVYDKMDGSLGILYWLNGMPYIASKGSFQSDQANHANKVFYSRYTDTFDKLNKKATYLFEIIYPENRIVVDYKGMDDLVLLGILDNATGDDLPLEYIGFPVVKRYDGVKDWSTLRDDNDKIKEGYIIRFSNGFRMKLKYEEYCRLHSIVTNVSNVSVWEYLSQNKSFDELLDKTPDEFDNFVRKTSESLKKDFAEILLAHRSAVIELLNTGLTTRREHAEYILNLKGFNSKILFEILDGKDPSRVIWSMIRPKFAKPFMVDEEA